LARILPHLWSSGVLQTERKSDRGKKEQGPNQDGLLESTTIGWKGSDTGMAESLSIFLKATPIVAAAVVVTPMSNRLILRWSGEKNYSQEFQGEGV